MLDQRRTQPGVSEGLDQHVQNGNKLRVGERIPVVMCKPVFELYFAETQQSCTLGGVTWKKLAISASAGGRPCRVV